MVAYRLLDVLPICATAVMACSGQPATARSSAPPPPAPLAPLPPPSSSDPRSEHACTEIVGLDNIALTFDGGKTLVQSHTPRKPGIKVYGVVTLGSPFALAAIAGSDIDSARNELFVSVDGGCRWSRRARLPAYRISEGRDGAAYAWGPSELIYAITLEGLRTLRAPTQSIQSIADDPSDRNRLTVLAPEGIYESADGGASWRLRSAGRLTDPNRGAPPPPAALNPLFFRRDAASSLFEMTADEGRSWIPNVRTVPDGDECMAPDGRALWVFGPTFFRSTDRGATFAEVARVASPNVGMGVSRLFAIGAQPDPGVVVFAGFDSKQHSRFLLRFDLQSLQASKQSLPLDPGDCPPNCRYGPSRGGERVTAATFVPGEQAALCLGIERDPDSSGQHDDP